MDYSNVKVTHAGLMQHNADGSKDLQKITQAGLVARSPEGTAAKGMNIRGNEDLWVEIQATTFKNWVNEHLKDAGGLRINDLATDLCDGTHLCALVESLQKKKLKPNWNHRPNNQHHYLENVTTALNAIEADGVKLVNIGNVDIVNGNVKLILGLIWSLIFRYQIGRSKFPPRKLMLAWLQAALPQCKVANLTTDWNSGVFLSALLDYCEPGLFPHWKSLDASQAIRNCTNAMNIASREFGIPQVLEPEYLASPWLDELSGMTYLSYFMKPGGPGYNATMRWVNSQTEKKITNFTTEWNDGQVFCEVINKLGGNAPKPEKLSTDPYSYESNIKKAMDAGEKLGVRPVLTPKDMAQPDVEHLGIMTYATNLQWVPPRPPLSNLVAVFLESSSGRVGEPTHFRVELMTRDFEMHQVTAYVVPPNGQPQRVSLSARGQGTFVPDKYGMHEIVVEVDDGKLGGHFFRVLPRFMQVAPPGMAPCALGSLVEVLVNATGAPKSEDILVTAYSPTGRPLRCPLKQVDEGHSAIFKPDEAGIWEIAITYQGRHIQGGPFTCAVFDPNGVSVHGLDGAMPLRAHSFEIDARGTGVSGDLNVDIVHEKRSLVCSVEKLLENKYRVTFMPRQNGKYRVYIYFNGYDVKGSPYIMRVGTKGRSGKTRSSPHHHENSSATSRYRSESPSMHFTSTATTTRRSYSPQVSPKESALKQDNSYNYHQQRDRDVYSPKLVGTPPRRGSFENSGASSSQLYSSSYKSETTKEEKVVPSPIDSFFKEKENEYRTRRSYDDIRTSPLEIRTASPVTMKTTSRYESSTTTRTSSPRLLSPASPPLTSFGVSRRSVSPSNYISSTSVQQRVSSPLLSTATRASELDSRIIKEKSTVYKSSYTSDGASPRNVYSPTRPGRVSTSPDVVDHASNLRVSALRNETRRDSWDAINKTKHLLSPNSLESLANMTESQLNTNISQYERPNRDTLDSETHRNTQFNKFLLRDRLSASPTTAGPTKLYESSVSNNNLSNSSSHHGYSATIRETNEEYVTKRENRETIDYEGGARTYSPLAMRYSGAGSNGGKAIVVKNIPDGIVGRPVEFKIDGSRAGSGNLEILVNGGRVTSSVRSLGGQNFIASFTPHESGTHLVQITFNGETVPGLPTIERIL